MYNDTKIMVQIAGHDRDRGHEGVAASGRALHQAHPQVVRGTVVGVR